MKSGQMYFRVFLTAFFLLNLIQAGFTELTGDEALYWMHWNKLDWGFRDHPPAIAVMIGAGYNLLASELGVRLFVVFANAITVWLIYRLTKPTVWWHFVLIVLSVPVLNLYGFMATPDVPLILFTAAYLNIWRDFIQQQNNKNTIVLAVLMAAMVWSKYHGVLIILLLFVSQRRLWLNAKFWLAALAGIVLFSPHLIWQIVHDLPTIKFHINDRNSDAWELKHILGYAGGQLLVFNPWLLVTTLYMLFFVRANDDFTRSLKWLIGGLMGLFFINSFRGRVEPHWTAPAVVAAICLFMTHLSVLFSRKWWNYGLIVFAGLILVVRVGLVVDFIPQLYRDFHRDKSKMKALKSIAGDQPVCFMNSYQNPSLYMFYTGGIAHAINNTEGGKNQYDYWSQNTALHLQPFVFVASYDAPGFEHVTSDKHQFKIRRYNDLPILHGLKLWTDEWLHHFQPGDTATIGAWLINRNAYDLNLNDTNHSIQWKAMYNHKKPNEANELLKIIPMPDIIRSGDSIRVNLQFRIPDRAGKNFLLFATQVDELPPTYQSNKLRVMIGD
jgi:hypothetical protein